jgi:isopentenyldiphosphate isomerase
MAPRGSPGWKGRGMEMEMEYFDVLDCTGEKTGEVVPRDEAHRMGVWHGAFHCLILNEKQGKGSVLFQKRAADKKIAPGRYDVSVGGHYTTGETAETAGPREIREELGLEVEFHELLPVGRRVFVYCFTPGVREYEFQDVYLLPRAMKMENLKLQREELDGVIEMDVEQGIALLSGKAPFVDHTLVRPDGDTTPVRISADDFVSCIDNYYLKFLLLAQNYIRGERNLLVI